MTYVLNRRRWLFCAGAAVALAGCGAQAATDTRIVSLGGDLTEIVHALGHADKIVARDSTSQYPASIQSLPDVGYVRTLGAEPILSMSPTLVIASAEVGPPEVIDQLRASGVAVVVAPDGHSLDALAARIQAVGDALNEPSEAERLVVDIQTRMDGVKKSIARSIDTPDVLFLLQGRDGSPMAAGRDTAADAMIRLAGGRNIFDTHDGYKPFALEALADSAPDALMMMDHSLAAMGGVEALRSHPAIGLTPAARDGRIIAADGQFLLGFGPRLPEAVAYVATALGTPADDNIAGK